MITALYLCHFSSGLLGMCKLTDWVFKLCQVLAVKKWGCSPSFMSTTWLARLYPSQIQNKNILTWYWCFAYWTIGCQHHHQRRQNTNQPFGKPSESPVLWSVGI